LSFIGCGRAVKRTRYREGNIILPELNGKG